MRLIAWIRTKVDHTSASMLEVKEMDERILFEFQKQLKNRQVFHLTRDSQQ